MDDNECDRGGGGENTTWFLKLSFYSSGGTDDVYDDKCDSK